MSFCRAIISGSSVAGETDDRLLYRGLLGLSNEPMATLNCALVGLWQLLLNG